MLYRPEHTIKIKSHEPEYISEVLNMFFGLLKMMLYLILLPIRLLMTLTRFAAVLILPIVILKGLKMMVMKHKHQ
jgi:uncharacterized membrane protein